jgi:hypothetical protein
VISAASNPRVVSAAPLSGYVADLFLGLIATYPTASLMRGLVQAASAWATAFGRRLDMAPPRLRRNVHIEQSAKYSSRTIRPCLVADSGSADKVVKPFESLRLDHDKVRNEFEAYCLVQYQVPRL